MSTDIETLRLWIRICLVIAAVCTTAFPVLYSFFPWYSTVLGRLLMLQAIAFALAIDLTLLFRFWTPPSVLLTFWINAFALTFIATSTLALTVMMWKTNRFNQKSKRTWLRRRVTDV